MARHAEKLSGASEHFAFTPPGARIDYKKKKGGSKAQVSKASASSERALLALKVGLQIARGWETDQTGGPGGVELPSRPQAGLQDYGGPGLAVACLVLAQGAVLQGLEADDFF